MNRKDKFMLSALFFLLGVVFGFLLAPIKQGFGNNCGNQHHYYGNNDKREAEDFKEDQEQ